MKIHIFELRKKQWINDWHRSCIRNLSSCEKKAWKKLFFSFRNCLSCVYNFDDQSFIHFFLCLLVRFLSLFFFLSFGLLVCRSVSLSSLILSRSLWPFCPFVLRILITKSVFFNKPKLYPHPQNSCNTWRNIGNRAFLVRCVICHCVNALIEEVKTTVSLTVVKNLAQWSFFFMRKQGQLYVTER